MKEACPVNCLCDAPKDWRTQTIPLAGLETVEIEGLHGEDHEFDFLKVIFRCTPMLNRVRVELSKGFTPNDDWWTKIHNIFMAYPSVECNADLVSRYDAWLAYSIVAKCCFMVVQFISLNSPFRPVPLF